MITKIEGMCQYRTEAYSCGKLATHLACGRDYFEEKGRPQPACYCETHARVVELEGDPEYTVFCPNCDCNFGVN